MLMSDIEKKKAYQETRLAQNFPVYSLKFTKFRF